MKAIVISNCYNRVLVEVTLGSICDTSRQLDIPYSPWSLLHTKFIFAHHTCLRSPEACRPPNSPPPYRDENTCRKTPNWTWTPARALEFSAEWPAMPLHRLSSVWYLSRRRIYRPRPPGSCDLSWDSIARATGRTKSPAAAACAARIAARYRKGPSGSRRIGHDPVGIK